MPKSDYQCYQKHSNWIKNLWAEAGLSPAVSEVETFLCLGVSNWPSEFPLFIYLMCIILLGYSALATNPPKAGSSPISGTPHLSQIPFSLLLFSSLCSLKHHPLIVSSPHFYSLAETPLASFGSWWLPWGSPPSSGQTLGYQLSAVSLSTNCPMGD